MEIGELLKNDAEILEKRDSEVKTYARGDDEKQLESIKK